MAEDYAKLFAECLRDGTRETLPPNCAKRGWPVSKTCRMSGGCPRCYSELLTKESSPRKSTSK